MKPVIQKELVKLGTIRQPSKKLVTAFAVEMDLDEKKVKSNYFEMEWPPKSGNIQEFPENDRAQWFSVEDARKKLFKGQRGFIDKLVEMLKYQETKKTEEPEYVQMSLFD